MGAKFAQAAKTLTHSSSKIGRGSFGYADSLAAETSGVILF